MRLLVNALACLASFTSFGQVLDYDGNNDGCVDGDDLLNFLTEYGQCIENQAFECGDIIIHYGDTYETIEINGQCWFKENLRYLPTVMGASNASTDEPRYYVYGYQGNLISEAMETDEYQTYGALYNYPAVISSTIALCPSGWHIPSNVEWIELSDNLGGNLVSGHKLKDNIVWNGSNESGFTAIPAGYKNINIFTGIGDVTYFWHSTPDGPNGTNTILGNSAETLISSTYQGHGMSVRCIKD